MTREFPQRSASERVRERTIRAPYLETHAFKLHDLDVIRPKKSRKNEVGTSSMLLHSCAAVSRLTVCCIHVRDSFFYREVSPQACPSVSTVSRYARISQARLFVQSEHSRLQYSQLGHVNFPELLKQVSPLTFPHVWLHVCRHQLHADIRHVFQVFWADNLRLKAVLSPAAANAIDACLPCLNSQSSRARVGGRSFH